MLNKKSFGPPPKRGPNPQGMNNGEEVKVGKGLKFRASGDISYEKKVQPKTTIKMLFRQLRQSIRILVTRAPLELTS